MSLKARARRAVNRALRPLGYSFTPNAILYDWQKSEVPASYHEAPLPAGAAERLRADHPRLRELHEAYAACDPRVTVPALWRPEHVKPQDLHYFRGDNAWVWQLRGGGISEISYVLVAYYAKSVDRLGLLERLSEDGLFGAFPFQTDGRAVSRDLLDAVLELNFLERHLEISGRDGWRILDIGAGYGRLAHRATAGLPSIESYLCTDAVAVSSFLCEYYLDFRRVSPRARMVPLHELDAALEPGGVDLAINVHSFPECTLEAIGWWLELLKRKRVRHLMIVPSALTHGGTKLTTNAGEDFSGIVEGAGYRRIACDRKYLDPAVQKYGVFPTHHHLFELRSSAA